MSGSAAQPASVAPDLAPTWHPHFASKIDVVDDPEVALGEIGRRFEFGRRPGFGIDVEAQIKLAPVGTSVTF